MTASPLLPPGMARRMAENEATRYPEREVPRRPGGSGGPRSTPWRPQRLILIDLVLPRVTALSASRDTVHAAASKLRSAFLTPGPPT